MKNKNIFYLLLLILLQFSCNNNRSEIRLVERESRNYDDYLDVSDGFVKDKFIGQAIGYTKKDSLLIYKTLISKDNNITIQYSKTGNITGIAILTDSSWEEKIVFYENGRTKSREKKYSDYTVKSYWKEDGSNVSIDTLRDF